MIFKQPYSERSASVLRVPVPWISLGFIPTEKFWIPGSFRANSRKVLGGGRFQINFREGWQDVKKKKNLSSKHPNRKKPVVRQLAWPPQLQSWRPGVSFNCVLPARFAIRKCWTQTFGGMMLQMHHPSKIIRHQQRKKVSKPTNDQQRETQHQNWKKKNNHHITINPNHRPNAQRFPLFTCQTAGSPLVSWRCRWAKDPSTKQRCHCKRIVGHHLVICWINFGCMHHPEVGTWSNWHQIAHDQKICCTFPPVLYLNTTFFECANYFSHFSLTFYVPHSLLLFMSEPQTSQSTKKWELPHNHKCLC